MRARLCLPWVLLRTGEGLLLRDCSCAGGSRRPGPAAKAGGTSDDCGCLRSTSASPGALLPTAELIDKPAQELEKIDAQAREKTEKLALELKTVQAQEEEKQEQRTLDLKKLEQQEVQENLAEEEESSEDDSLDLAETIAGLQEQLAAEKKRTAKSQAKVLAKHAELDKLTKGLPCGKCSPLAKKPAAKKSANSSAKKAALLAFAPIGQGFAPPGEMQGDIGGGMDEGTMGHAPPDALVSEIHQHQSEQRALEEELARARAAQKAEEEQFRARKNAAKARIAKAAAPSPAREAVLEAKEKQQRLLEEQIPVLKKLIKDEKGMREDQAATLERLHKELGQLQGIMQACGC